ncbi:anhydro-N-acetylmuramic acid kinase [Geminocystis sp. NIES-3708]|uniref:anhydro-N-acetylmuramic acid kinase n=1 Tax=Geminocystis sp. NIES-3708 TaxID=1615909 RepID=UPI0005FCBE0E|nr:anhydro-N-acetylmuramic acid kinase [Geminocystis sp. NIES-3708]BAQ59970.1 anhydro-N-acetylmuramic acid kinase [Geminocystis sp. NIES-3708]
MIIVGLMSGTSVDGIDAAVVEIKGQKLDLEVNLLVGQTFPYSPSLRTKILQVCEGDSLSMTEFSQLDSAIATEFSQAVLNIIPDNIKVDLIGSHGQTVYHQPPHKNQLGYSLQLGRGDVIAHLTGIDTVNNFRVADIAVGGQGAPLVSKIDLCLYNHPRHSRCLQNIGGIGNATYLPSTHTQKWQEKVIGWDTGPGNALIDLAVQKLTDNQQTFDFNGDWSRQGKPCKPLIKQWLKEDFFHQKPPKSTGRELFGHIYLEKCHRDAQNYHLSDADWLATLTELTVASIADSYHRFLPSIPHEVILAGGGSRNSYLKERLQSYLPDSHLLISDDLGISGEFKEAIAFAILAYWHVNNYEGNLPNVTGAKKEVILGQIHKAIYN